MCCRHRPCEVWEQIAGCKWDTPVLVNVLSARLGQYPFHSLPLCHRAQRLLWIFPQNIAELNAAIIFTTASSCHCQLAYHLRYLQVPCLTVDTIRQRLLGGGPLISTGPGARTTWHAVGGLACEAGPPTPPPEAAPITPNGGTRALSAQKVTPVR